MSLTLTPKDRAFLKKLRIKCDDDDGPAEPLGGTTFLQEARNRQLKSLADALERREYRHILDSNRQVSDTDRTWEGEYMAALISPHQRTLGGHPSYCERRWLYPATTIEQRESAIRLAQEASRRRQCCKCGAPSPGAACYL